MSLITALATRIFPWVASLHVERVVEGGSTHVYRIYRGDEVFYLRVLPEVDGSFAPEVRVHTLLRERNVKIPEVVYFEHYNEALHRSVMVTTEIKGRHIGHCFVERDVRNVLIEAGRDLAVINSIRVEGFGWIKRDKSEVTQLEAELPSYRVFAYEQLEETLEALSGYVLSRKEVGAIQEIFERFDGWLASSEHGWLAHGDLDATHIYHEDGRYSGIIDFGEIRGCDPFYDLGHLKMREGELLPFLLLPSVLEGYKGVVELPPDYEQRICFSNMLVALEHLARKLRKRPEDVPRHPGIRSIREDIEVLLT